MEHGPVVAARQRAPLVTRVAIRTVAVLAASAARGRAVGTSRALGLFGRDRLDCGDDVLQLGDLTQRAPGRQAVVFGHRQDERALMRLEALEEGIELVGHKRAVAVSGRADKLVIGKACCKVDVSCRSVAHPPDLMLCPRQVFHRTVQVAIESSAEGFLTPAFG